MCGVCDERIRVKMQFFEGIADHLDRLERQAVLVHLQPDSITAWGILQVKIQAVKDLRDELKDL